MEMLDQNLWKDVFKVLAAFVVAIVLCRFTGGYFSLVMAMAGLIWAISGKQGKALACMAFFPLLVVFNRDLLPLPTILGLTLRLSPLLIGVLLAIQKSKNRQFTSLPFGVLLLYLFFAAISSANGLCPSVSFLKLLNFLIFLIGIWLGTKNLQENGMEVYFLRIAFLAISCLVVFGSAATLPFPLIAYSTNFMFNPVQSNEAAAFVLNESQGVALFSGIVNHSQALGPILACCITLSLADMIFVEKRTTFLHLAILCCALVELYMTRSRTGLLSSTVGLIMVLSYGVDNISMNPFAKRRIKGITSSVVFLLLIAAAYAQFSNRAITRWIYKSNEESITEEVTFKDAVTNTRQGLIQESMSDFRANRLFGKGFQVNHETRELYGGKGFALTAPVEKGLLFVMILGEGGIIGAFTFFAFLANFYSTCSSRQLPITIVMFTTFLATNIGEATFFSPGGIGGTLWTLCVIGGFVLDAQMHSPNLRANRIPQRL